MGDWAGLENTDDDAAVARRRLRGRASGSRAAGARVLDEDDNARRFVEDGLMASDRSGLVLLAGRSRTSGRCDGDCVERGASELLVGVVSARGGWRRRAWRLGLGQACVGLAGSNNTTYCR